MKTLISISTAFLLALVSSPVLAQIEVSTTAEIEVIEVNPDGTESVRRKAATRVVPGTEVIYTITAKNAGDEPADQVVVTNPVPAQTRYVEGSAAGANTDIPVLEEAMNLISSAIDGLSNLRGRIGSHSQVLQSAKSAHSDFTTFATNLVSTIEDTDVAQATTELAFAEVQLQGSYLAISRLRELSLLQFL